jgi:hypothetical protein
MSIASNISTVFFSDCNSFATSRGLYLRPSRVAQIIEFGVPAWLSGWVYRIASISSIELAYIFVIWVLVFNESHLATVLYDAATKREARYCPDQNTNAHSDIYIGIGIGINLERHSYFYTRFLYARIANT